MNYEKCFLVCVSTQKEMAFNTTIIITTIAPTTTTIDVIIILPELT